MKQLIFSVSLLASIAGAATSESMSPTMEVARANKTLVKISPEFRSGPEAIIPEAAKATGEHGKVIVAGIIGVDGHFSEVTVAVSSHSAVLDKVAVEIAGATVFDPAKDANHLPIAIFARMPVEFDNARSSEPPSGVQRYKCGQFAKDYRWWTSVWPQDKKDDFYLLVLGLSTMAKSRRPDGKIDMAAFASVNRDFDARWKAAVEECEKAPELLFVDVFKPEGDMFMHGTGKRR